MKRNTPRPFNAVVLTTPSPPPVSTRDAGYHHTSGVMASSPIGATILARILDFSLSLPTEEGEAATAIAAVLGISRLLSEPRIAVAVSTDTALRLYVAPAGTIEERDPVSASFPIFGTAFELTIPLPGISGWMCIAADSRMSTEQGDALSRLASVVGRSLALARVCVQARSLEDEMRELNARFVQAQKLATLGELAAGMVHELNNPLTSIVAYTEYLERKWKAADANEDDIARLGRISESSSRMLRFTRDLVSYVRVPSETPVPVALQSVIDRALAFCEHILAHSHVIVERRYEPAGEILGLAEPLTQVFVNLVTNACHAMPEDGGKILISIVDDEGTISVSVLDSGRGIPEAHREKVFVPFFTTKETGKGTGLGLSIVKSIVDRHQGTIDVSNGDLGGATFTLKFPSSSRVGT